MLTNTQIKNLKPKDKVYRISDQQGLCIEIRPTGKKYWRYRFRYANKATMMPLGEYPSVSLSEARKAHIEAKTLLNDGINPITQSRVRKQQTQSKQQQLFKQYAEQFLDDLKPKRSVGYIRQIQSNLNKHIYPAIGSKSIFDIDTVDIMDMMANTLTRVKNTTHRGTGEVTAELCRQQVGLVYRYAMRSVRGLNDPTVAAKGVIERPPIEHARDLTRKELKQLLIQLSKYQGFPSTVGVIKTMLYTIARTKEARNMRWQHIDMQAKLWSIPRAELARRKSGDRNMKTDKPHIVPLCSQMLNLLQNMYSISGNGVFVFPSPKNPDKPIGATTVNRALEYMSMKEVSGHDTRATCSTYLHGMGYDTQHINLQMAHVDNSVSGGYNHAKWLPERTIMIQVWADYLDSLLTSEAH